MSHTNSTANLGLPQFIGSDKPTWLGDVNGAFSAIDSYAGTNDAAVAAAASDASSAISQASAAVSTANNANTTAGNASTAATNAVGVANNAVAIAGTVDSKVGLLADLHTTDRTSIVNAINEVKDAEGDLTQLTTTDKSSLVSAINEVSSNGGVFSNALRYNDATNKIEYWDPGTQSWTVLMNGPSMDVKGALVYHKGGNTYIIVYARFNVESGTVTLSGIDSSEEQTITTSYSISDTSYGLTDITKPTDGCYIDITASAVAMTKNIAGGITTANGVASAFLPENESNYTGGRCTQNSFQTGTAFGTLVLS